MSTVDKAISLLELFSTSEPELGLSELARRGGLDKATTRRLLLALAARGVIDQDRQSRRYRLGAMVSRLARIREAHFPFRQVATDVARGLAQETGETVHLAEYSGGALVTVHVELSAKANRVNVDVGQALPLHATASGIAFLAFAAPAVLETYCQGLLQAFTPHTLVDRGLVVEAVRATARRGYSRSVQGYEEGVHSVAAPILDADGHAVGTLAVASPVSRVTDWIAADQGRAVARAANDVSVRLNGRPAAGPGRQAPLGRPAS